MASDHARRGRPRGSGLDDRAELGRIAELLDADPSLKPTTAIKAIGVTDPSSIRRLREKLKTLPSPDRSGGAADPDWAVAQQLADAYAPPVQTGEATHGTLRTSSDTDSDDSCSWIANLCAIGFSAMASTVEAQVTAFNEFLKVPEVESALRRQLQFNEVAKALCPKRSDIRSTLH